MRNPLPQDVRYALRLLAKSPGFTAAAVVTLALGIGANTAIFSVVDTVLLRALPLREPGRIVRLQEDHQQALNVTGATFRDVRERNRVFSQVAAYRIFSRNLSDTRQSAPPEEIDAAFVSQDFLPLLGIRPFLGDGFSPEQFRENAEGSVILSYGLWLHHFGSDPGIVGKIIRLHGNPALVAGVMPLGFSFPEGVQAWMPLPQDLAFPQNRRAHLFTTLARVRVGVSMEAVRGDLKAIADQIQQENHDVDPGFTFSAQRLQDNLVSGVRPTLLLLLAAVAFVLLIACANVANLLLSRSVTRQKEIAVRVALGASRTRIVRQLLTESMLLGLIGGVAGAGLGLWLVKALGAAYPDAVPGFAAPTLDARVLLFAFAASLLASLLFGSLPAAQTSDLNLFSQLGESGRSTASVRRQRVRSLLVISEVALAMVLLTGAGLLIRSFLLLHRVDCGFNSSDLAVVRLTLPDSRYGGISQWVRFVDDVSERLRSLPGVQSVAAAGTLPFMPAPVTDLEIQGQTYEPGNEPTAQILTATPDYFRTLGIRLLTGRSFGSQDVVGHPITLIINHTMAQQFWPGENAIGKRVVMKDWGESLPGEVVGVVSDVKQDSLEIQPQPAIYYSFAQFEQGTLSTYLIVRARAAPIDLAAAIRGQIWAVDREQPVHVQSMDDIISGSLERRRFVLTLLGTFAGLALLLAVVGIYGVIAYSVSQRTREFGIRMALGAQPYHVLVMLLSQSLRTLTIGLLLGIASALAMTRFMASLLFGIRATDPLTFVVMAAILLVVALLASYLPARRAAKVDPMVALRYE
ncbi:MAG: ABC transporter permease [Terriglobales bacterium]